MHTVDLLEQAVRAAQQAGYHIRHEWLGGNGGGACEIKGRKSLFIDLAQSPEEQLESVLQALRQQPAAPLPEAGPVRKTA